MNQFMCPPPPPRTIPSLSVTPAFSFLLPKLVCRTSGVMMGKFTLTLVLLCFTLLAAAQVPRQCSQPPRYPNTKVSAKTTKRPKFFHGEKVYYSCAQDYTVSEGSRSVQCNKGQWTKLALKCEKISCGYAGDLSNGELHYEGTAVVGDKVFAVCNKGYTLTTLDHMICERTGWMGAFPKCEKGQTTCSHPKVVNSAESQTSVYQAGQNASITCSPGFQLEGAQNITCNRSGQWQPNPPQCRPSLTDEQEQATTDGSCTPPTDGRALNIHIAERYWTRKTFDHNERIQFVCGVGHTPAGGSRFRRCINGQWTPLLLQCERQVCGSAGEVRDGQFIYTGVQFGDSATAVCDEGFHLVGQATRHCMGFGWDGRVAVCEAVQCDSPPAVAHAEHNGPPEPPYMYKSAVQYRCRVGVLVGSRDVWCTKDGSWSSVPECKEISCPAPRVLNASWIRSHVKRFQYRDTLSIGCHRGYTRIGPNNITCDERGLWFPGVPKCRPRFK